LRQYIGAQETPSDEYPKKSGTDDGGSQNYDADKSCEVSDGAKGALWRKQRAQCYGDQGIPHRERQCAEERDAIVARNVTDNGVGEERGGKDYRSVSEPAPEHPDDGEGRPWIPRGDVERAQWLDVARPIKRQIKRREYRCISKVPSGCVLSIDPIAPMQWHFASL
jgi:hypothetical protein